VGVLSATVFYKDIKDIQITQPNTAFASAPAEIQMQVAEAGYSPAELSNPSNLFTTVINGPKTTLWGYELAYSQELSFLPGALKGLGVTANFSHYQPEEERLWVLVPNSGDGMALNQANLIGRYKIGKFKAQISGTWTQKRLFALFGLVVNPDGSITPTGTSNVNVQAYLDARWIVSANMEYQINRYAIIFAGVNNLFNAPKFNYQERETFTTRNGLYGASINVGVKGAF
jgi:outer membrane receptor protein involved in Fe transport